MVEYTYDQLVQAYRSWVATGWLEIYGVGNECRENLKKRIKAWDQYCDVRDGYPLGFTAWNRLCPGGTPSEFLSQGQQKFTQNKHLSLD